MQKAICQISGKEFIITDRDIEFYKKIGVPLPKLCPEERRRRRFAFRNERSLYRRKSSLSNKDIISCVHEDEPMPIYSGDEWFGDSWDASFYGQPYDFSKSFFEQFYNLQQKVPMIANNANNNHNCPYVNYAASCKDCHLIFGSVYCEDCMYGNPYYCKSCIDSLLVRDSELCYDCVTCEKCYECFFCQDCAGSFSLIYCYDCHGSRNCIGCTGLRNKEYYIFNRPFSKEEYTKQRQALDLYDKDQREQIKKKFDELKLMYPRRYIMMLQTQNCDGDYIYSSKETHDCYDVQRCEDCSYCAQVIDMKDCYDCNYMEECELCYDYICNYQNQRVNFTVWCNQCHDIWYSMYCVSSGDLFGCIGVSHKNYCILNKQYSREEYFELRDRIIEQMKQEGIFGEFLHPQISPFCYNETVANEYFPLTKDEALRLGYRWRDKNPKDYLAQTCIVPNNITKINDSILHEILACRVCTKNFKLQKGELEFYKTYLLPIPQKCPDCRHAGRLALRNPRMLFDRQCKKCNVKLKTTYAPERPESVFCEKCYLGEVY